MGCDVFANNSEIACKAGGGKVIASFPDVCLTPPSPPAGPIPVPYPNTSFSKDMKKGSKAVKIKGKEVMLKDQSFYKTSPLGNEAATKGQGAGVITHVITGKTYFIAWSMDVKFEGQNVDRHTDVTTSNHASPMANTFTPNLNLAKMGLGKTEYENQTCRQEVLDGIQTRKKRIKKQLRACRKALPPGMTPGGAGGKAVRDAKECYRLKCNLREQRRLLAIREEEQAKCFNDPSKDNVPGKPTRTKKLKKKREDHDGEIARLRDGIGNTKRAIGAKKCR